MKSQSATAFRSLAEVEANPRGFLESLFYAAVDRALPIHSLLNFLPTPPPVGSGGRTVVVGAGKAAGAMAHAVEALWPSDAPLQGLVVTRYDHTPPRPPGLAQRIEVVEASHPVPDHAGEQAATRILEIVNGLTPNDLVICLISGGGSAVLSLPADGLTLENKQHITQRLLACGATISEMNCVRKHLSKVKGGRLAAACHPARVVTLAISDVPGDDVSVIASGPTVPDASTCKEALDILRRYEINVPLEVIRSLESGSLETAKAGDEKLRGHEVHMIATPKQSLEVAAERVRAAGLQAHIFGDEIEGESREVGKVHAAVARSVVTNSQPFARPCVILSGGETTVTLRPLRPGVPKGRGGRAGEFCMGATLALQGKLGIYVLAADTDGFDGVENNAGAVVTPDTLQRAQALNLKVQDHLNRNDSVGFFGPLGDLVVSGPTHTNVNDFRAILIL